MIVLCVLKCSDFCSSERRMLNPRFCSCLHTVCKTQLQKEKNGDGLFAKLQAFIMPFMLVIKLGLVAMETTVYSTTSSDLEACVNVGEERKSKTCLFFISFISFVFRFLP